ncbi:hypothetical protein C7M61_004920 [Candidozyma pseudohaemuli]|uniref:Uncharacterized protein n=1 Tax=Candidozyma pseudohaemuli TaxID=418784 RepID=A0A2P7YFI1_9ASCO|nr:hypothetical protein C7M61_004920 [[Candida] pseudohaemulonii]PSK34727.1 hypothetical protein C7M61_004920 [[Candida] pseudohaemulonii]
MFMSIPSETKYPPDATDEPFHSFIYVPHKVMREMCEPGMLIPKDREAREKYLQYLDFVYGTANQEPALTTPQAVEVTEEDIKCIDPRLIMRKPGDSLKKRGRKPNAVKADEANHQENVNGSSDLKQYEPSNLSPTDYVAQAPRSSYQHTSNPNPFVLTSQESYQSPKKRNIDQVDTNNPAITSKRVRIRHCVGAEQ